VRVTIAIFACYLSPGLPQYHRRSGIKGKIGRQRLEIVTGNISSDSEEVADENRFICIGMECPAGQVYQLETPTEGLAGECSSVELVEPSGQRIPPFSLIMDCLYKIRQEQMSIVFVCPIWPSQPWFPLLLELTCDVPLVLPQSQNLLESAQGLSQLLVAANSIWLAT
jgi:hypothetical protein